MDSVKVSTTGIKACQCTPGACAFNEDSVWAWLTAAEGASSHLTSLRCRALCRRVLQQRRAVLAVPLCGTRVHNHTLLCCAGAA